MTTTHPLNRHIFIADNLDLLKSLDNESIDLVCCDPPFAKNQTFSGAIRPPLTAEEISQETDILASWGIRSQRDAEEAGIEWPSSQKDNKAKFTDIWRWESSVHQDWADMIKNDYPALHKVIEAACATAGESMGAYLVYMAVRIIEMKRILKPTGSVYIHCDHTANSYLRILMDAIFWKERGSAKTDYYQNEIVWKYGLGGSSPKRFSRKKDYILFYAKSQEDFFFDKPTEPSTSAMMGGKEKGMLDVWLDIPALNNQADERTGYPTQKPVELAERIIKASCPPGGIVLDPFAGCAYVPVAAERNKRQWIACDISIRALTVLKRQFKKFSYKIDDENPEEGKLDISVGQIVTRSPHHLPVRTDKDPIAAPDINPMPARKFKIPASDIPEPEMKDILLEMSGWQAWCCGFANRKHDGTIVRSAANFHLDHIDPKSQRGSNKIMFRAPLCPEHNQQKKDRRISLEELRDEIEKADGFYTKSRSDLIDLAEARERAINIHTDYMLKKNPHSTPLPISEM